jgi:hypothetical protein
VLDHHSWSALLRQGISASAGFHWSVEGNHLNLKTLISVVNREGADDRIDDHQLIRTLRPAQPMAIPFTRI